jgi:hypothetical protein
MAASGLQEEEEEEEAQRRGDSSPMFTWLLGSEFLAGWWA